MPSLKKTKPLSLLFTGHDFKFLTPLIIHFENHSGFHVLLDEHEGHEIRNVKTCKACIEEADIIFCEWCMGNAEWYSHHKKENQLLLIRLHHQEIYQDLIYLERIKWENVDCIIFICQNNMRLFLEKFPHMADRAVLIFNLIDCDAFNLKKLWGAEFNLGFMGVAPMRKGPHLAFEILARLKEIDSRYTLFIKGKSPWEYDWLLRRPEERRYYEELYALIDGSAYANSVVFDPHGNDVPAWFSKIGFLLSTSEHEGSHQAVAEGMASGAIPVIRNWAGADLLYPKEFVFETIDDAVRLIRKWHTQNDYVPRCEAARKYAQDYFDTPLIIEQYKQLLSGLLLGHGRFYDSEIAE
jgi:glycosyltransferase involved in cell wall biosynthesis